MTITRVGCTVMDRAVIKRMLMNDPETTPQEVIDRLSHIEVESVMSHARDIAMELNIMDAEEAKRLVAEQEEREILAQAEREVAEEEATAARTEKLEAAKAAMRKKPTRRRRKAPATDDETQGDLVS